MTTSTTALRAGDVFHETFKIVRSVGESGARSAQYIAEQGVPARTVALRVLDPGLVADAAGRKRFEELAGWRSKVRSNHVVDLLDAGVDTATGAPWFATPSEEAKSLDAYAREPLDPVETLDLVEQIAHGVGAIHDAGLVHAALDPSAILVIERDHFASERTLRVNDFWSATWLRESGDAGGKTAANAWAAPEVAEHGVALTAAADVWSLALITFRLLVGKPYGAVAAQGRPDSASKRASSLGFDGELPEGFDAWFAQSIAPAPSDRFATVDEAFDALTPILEGDDGKAKATAPSVPLLDRLPPRARSSEILIPVALGVATLLALGARQLLQSRRAVTSDPAPVVAGAAPAAPTVTAIDARMTEDLVQRLGAAPHGSPAWIAASANDPGSTARAEQLGAIFTRAGWNVHPLISSRVRLRPGYFLYAGDDDPPAYVNTLSDALHAVGMINGSATGYRDYYRERTAADPNFAGFPFDTDQSFILAVGRTP